MSGAKSWLVLVEVCFLKKFLGFLVLLQSKSKQAKKFVHSSQLTTQLFAKAYARGRRDSF